jgi:DNA-binding PadR family transcriptional regulator
MKRHNLTQTEGVVLSYMCSSPAFFNQMVVDTKIPPLEIKTALKRLRERGWIQEKEDKATGEKVYRLTPEGRKVLSAFGKAPFSAPSQASLEEVEKAFDEALGEL